MQKTGFRKKSFITSDNFEIEFWYNFPINKEGPPALLFNYGLVCSNQHWQKQIDYFHEKGFPIICHNYRGHFAHHQNGALKDVTFHNIALDIKKIVDVLKRKKVILLGHSMGVNVSLEFAKLYPELTHQLVLINGTVLPVKSVMFDNNLMETVQPVLKKIAEKFPSTVDKLWKHSEKNPLIRLMIRRGGFNPEQTSDVFVKEYLRNIGILGPKLFFQMFEEFSHHDIISHVSDIKAKTLIIEGDKDLVIPPHLQTLLAHNLPHAKLVKIKKGSHVPQVDFPDKVNVIIENFLMGKRKV